MPLDRMPEVGERVVLTYSEWGVDEGNPEQQSEYACGGVVEYIATGKLPIGILWDNGRHNDYAKKHLDWETPKTTAQKYEVGKKYRKVSESDGWIAKGEVVTFVSYSTVGSPYFKNERGLEFLQIRSDIFEPVDQEITITLPSVSIPLRDQVYGKSEHEAYMKRQAENTELQSALDRHQFGEMRDAVHRFLCGPAIDHESFGED